MYKIIILLDNTLQLFDYYYSKNNHVHFSRGEDNYTIGFWTTYSIPHADNVPDSLPTGSSYVSCSYPHSYLCELSYRDPVWQRSRIYKNGRSGLLYNHG